MENKKIEIGENDISVGTLEYSAFNKIITDLEIKLQEALDRQAEKRAALEALSKQMDDLTQAIKKEEQGSENAKLYQEMLDAEIKTHRALVNDLQKLYQDLQKFKDEIIKLRRENLNAELSLRIGSTPKDKNTDTLLS